MDLPALEVGHRADCVGWACARAGVFACSRVRAVTYELRAAVAGAPLITELARLFRHAAVVPLNRGLALIPASGPWLAELARPGERRSYPEFDLLGCSLAGLLREASVRGPVAYVEIEEAQDLTFEAAVGWSGGELALPPRALRPGQARPAGGGPVVQAFGLLGVAGEPGQDEWAPSAFTSSAIWSSGWRFPG